MFSPTSAIVGGVNMVYLNSNLTIGIDEKFKKVFNLYPNPVTNEFTIDANLSNNASMKLTIFNLSGQKIKEENVQAFPSTINISELASGIYEIRLTGEADFFMPKKIVKF